MEMPNVDDVVNYTKEQVDLDPPVTLEATVTAVYTGSGEKLAVDLTTAEREDFREVAFSVTPAPGHWSPVA